MAGKRTAAVYDCCAYPFIDLSYAIRIRRRTLYYGINLIIPCVLISSMSLLTFVLPPDAGEKISLGVTIMLSLSMFQLLVADAMPQTSESVPLIGVTILLSLTVFLMMVAESMPPTSDAVPLIGMYFSCTMVTCSLSVVFTVIVLNYHHRDAESHPVPNWVKKFICTYLANILCMKIHHRDEGGEPLYVRRRKNASFRTSSFRETNATVEMKERSSKSLLANVLDLEDDIRTVGGGGGIGGGFGLGISSPPTYQNVMGSSIDGAAGGGVGGAGGGGGGGAPSGAGTHQCSTRNDLAAVVQELRIITKKISDDTADSGVSSEWKFAARVIDRLCLIMFTCFTVISTCAILFSAPDVFKG